MRKEVFLLLKMYSQGHYSTEKFCELFIDYYFFSKSAYRCFHGKERAVLDELAAAAEYFSDNIEEVDESLDVHMAEETVKEKFYKVLEVFQLYDFEKKK